MSINPEEAKEKALENESREKRISHTIWWIDIFLEHDYFEIEKKGYHTISITGRYHSVDELEEIKKTYEKKGWIIKDYHSDKSKGTTMAFALKKGEKDEDPKKDRFEMMDI